MSWLQLTLESDVESAVQMADFFEKFEAVSVSLSAADDEKIFDSSAAVQEDWALWQNVRVIALLHTDTDLDVLLGCLRNKIGHSVALDYTLTMLAEPSDWVQLSQSEHGLKVFADCLCICPSWCEPPKDDMAVVFIDPCLAFGTGAHETTAVCLEWLAGSSLVGRSVIDYGCGSGILGLAAVKLGAKQVYAVDIDRQAVQISKENAKANNVAEQIKVAHPDDIALPVSDVLVANLLLNSLNQLAVCFAGLVHASGDVVLSGLLSTQVDECLAVYQQWFVMSKPVFKQEWAMLHGVRRC